MHGVLRDTPDDPCGRLFGWSVPPLCTSIESVSLRYLGVPRVSVSTPGFTLTVLPSTLCQKDLVVLEVLSSPASYGSLILHELNLYVPSGRGFFLSHVGRRSS